MQSNSEEEKGEKNNREKNELQKENIKSKSKNDFGGAVEFSQELEKKILHILGKLYKYMFLNTLKLTKHCKRYVEGESFIQYEMF
jgi:hypothetical protein